MKNKIKSLSSITETVRIFAQVVREAGISSEQAARNLQAAMNCFSRRPAALHQFRSGGGKFIILCALCVLCARLSFAGDDKDTKTVRDSNGAIVERQTKTSTGVTVRDADGKLTERRQTIRNTDGSETVIVRDYEGKILRREEKKK